MKYNRKANLTVIFITVFIDLMGFGILIPILPTFATKELAISDFQIGIVIAIYSFFQFLLNPFFGSLSDKFGRRPILLFTLLLTSVSYLIFSISDSFEMLLFSRILAGIGGSNIAVAQAIISDITPQSERAKGMGLIGAAFGLGFVFGPFIGGVLAKFSYSYAGLGSALFSFLSFLFAFIVLKETIKMEKSKISYRIKLFNIKLLSIIAKNRPLFVTMLLFFTIIFAVANIYGTFALLAYKKYNFDEIQIGILFSISGLIGALVQGILIKNISLKYSERSVIVIGTFLMMISLALIPYGYNFIGVAVVISLLSIGTGLLQPTLLGMVSNFAPIDKQGEIFGINQSFASLARVLGPLWGGFAFDYYGYNSPFITGAIFTFFTFLIGLFFIKFQTSNRRVNV